MPHKSHADLARENEDAHGIPTMALVNSLHGVVGRGTLRSMHVDLFTD